jgi:hypothetical protein
MKPRRVGVAMSHLANGRHRYDFRRWRIYTAAITGSSRGKIVVLQDSPFLRTGFTSCPV